MKTIEFLAGPSGVCTEVRFDGQKENGIQKAKLTITPISAATLEIVMRCTMLTKFENVTVLIVPWSDPKVANP